MYLITFKQPVLVQAFRTGNNDSYIAKAIAIYSESGGHATTSSTGSPLPGTIYRDVYRAIVHPDTEIPLGTMIKTLDDLVRPNKGDTEIGRAVWEAGRNEYWSESNRIPAIVEVAADNIRAVTSIGG